MARNHSRSPEYMKRREELIEWLKPKSRHEIATRLAHLETEVKKSAANERELRKVITKYQGIFGRLMTILTASTNQTPAHGGNRKNGLDLPFSYEIAFNNCRVIIADYYEDVRFCNPAGGMNCGEKQKAAFKNKLEKLRS